MDGIDWQQVTAALQAAAAGRDHLMVVAQPDLRGAMVCGRGVEVYVVVKATGINVECWRGSGNDPYKIVSVGGLDDAVRVAVTEVLSRRAPRHLQGGAAKMAKDDKNSGGSHADDRDFGKPGGGSGRFGKPEDQNKGGGGKHGGGDGGKK